MKIDELIIDGFKSYAVRTTIDKWDPTFNAITVNIIHLSTNWFTSGIKRVRKVKYPRRNMFCPWDNEHEHCQGSEPAGFDIQTRSSWSHKSQCHYRIRQ